MRAEGALPAWPHPKKGGGGRDGMLKKIAASALWISASSLFDRKKPRMGSEPEAGQQVVHLGLVGDHVGGVLGVHHGALQVLSAGRFGGHLRVGWGCLNQQLDQ